MSTQLVGGAVVADREITITRVFDVPRNLVFAAWTDPEHLVHWWGPYGCMNSDCEIDLRPGGTFQLQMHAPDGTIYPCKGTIREVVRPERIVIAGIQDCGHACGAGVPPRSIVTVTFEESNGKTTLTIHTLFQSSADRHATENAGYVPGWSQTFERLVAFLRPS